MACCRLPFRGRRVGKIRDEFLSEEDLDLVNLSDEELDYWWNAWFAQAQATNDEDKDSYSHGVFCLVKIGGK
jgi:hypothetical protein